jgi:hypothetical protein
VGLSEQVNVAEPSSDAKVNVGRGLLTTPAGPDSIDTVGGAVSTANVLDAGVGSAPPDASLARTRKVWAPSGSSVNARGEAQGANGAASRLHAKRAAG